MARPKPQEEGVPLWIVSFGDMMSLLLTFFILLFSMSTLEIPKIAAAIEALNQGFGYHGSGQSTNFEVVKRRVEELSKKQGDRRPITPRVNPPIVAERGKEIRIKHPNIITDSTLGFFIWFDLNSDELTEQAKLNLGHVKEQFGGARRFVIVIKGHAGANENQPYRSAFTLAFTRANNVRNYLVSLDMPEEYLHISVVGNFDPIDKSILPFELEPRLANSVVQIVPTKEERRNIPGMTGQ
jgi:chemotaxis protein MotB